MKKQHLTFNSVQTKKMGNRLAKKTLKTIQRKKSLVVGLKGNLGAGKTTFLQGFAKGLGIKEKILSPTFVIFKKFKIPQKYTGCTFVNFYHIDCYRIEKPKDLLDLGFKEMISSPQNIIVIEWADKIRKIMPKRATWISFEFIDERTRKITLCNDLC